MCAKYSKIGKTGFTVRDTIAFMLFGRANKITTWLTFLNLFLCFPFIAVLQMFFCFANFSILNTANPIYILIIENYSVFLKYRFIGFAFVCAIAMLHLAVFLSQ